MVISEHGGAQHLRQYHAPSEGVKPILLQVAPGLHWVSEMGISGSLNLDTFQQAGGIGVDVHC